MSLRDLMKKNARLRKAAETAKKAEPTGGMSQYNGPAGELICKFSGMRSIDKDDKTYVALDFVVDGMIAGQEKYGGQRCGTLRSMQDSDYATAEDELNRLFGDIQRLGVQTADLSMEQIDAAVADLVGHHFTIAAVARKNAPGKLNFYINGTAAGSDEQDYSASEADDAPEPEPEPPKASTGKKGKAKPAPEPEPEPEPESDEWNDEEALAAQDEDEVSASDWIGQSVQYKPKGAPKLLEFTIVAADDDEGSVIIERNGKKLKVMFDALTLPE